MLSQDGVAGDKVNISQQPEEGWKVTGNWEV